jgi:predicted nucleic acid-binding protein
MRLADTNILIYAADTSPEERQKRVVAVAVLKEEDLTLSVQVLQEFYHQATRPTSRLGMTREQALAFLEPFMGLTIQPVTREVFRTAAGIADRHGISYWDAAIVAAARILGCDAVYSEDLNEGQLYDGVVVINPFR